jgi:sulfoxide reductase heme-binding subunit YedZ
MVKIFFCVGRTVIRVEFLSQIAGPVAGFNYDTQPMGRVLKIVNSLPFFWLLLAIPALAMLYAFWVHDLLAMDMVPETGEFSARLMILAMMVSPLVAIFGQRSWTSWLLKRRRSLGVGAFLYAVLHLLFYILDMEALEAIWAEFFAPSIITGWIAFLLFLPLAITSNNAAMRALKRRWKQLQRLVYVAAVLTLFHWIWIHDDAIAAWAHFIPLIVAQLLRGILIYVRRGSEMG